MLFQENYAVPGYMNSYVFMKWKSKKGNVVNFCDLYQRKDKEFMDKGI